MAHLGNTPLHDVAEVFIVDVVVLFPNRPLSTFLEFILPISDSLGEQPCHVEGYNGWGDPYSHFDQTIIRQHGDDLVQLFRLQPHSPCQVVVFKTAKPNEQGEQSKHPYKMKQASKCWDAALTATYTGCRASWSMIMVYFGS